MSYWLKFLFFAIGFSYVRIEIPILMEMASVQAEISWTAYWIVGLLIILSVCIVEQVINNRKNLSRKEVIFQIGMFIILTTLIPIIGNLSSVPLANLSTIEMASLPQTLGVYLAMVALAFTLISIIFFCICNVIVGILLWIVTKILPI